MSVTDVKACVRVVNVYWFGTFSRTIYRLPLYCTSIYIQATWNDDGKNVESNVYIIYCVPRSFLRVSSLYTDLQVT